MGRGGMASCGSGRWHPSPRPGTPARHQRIPGARGRRAPAGNAAAARWSALRAVLRTDKSFADLPPAAVTAGDRYLAYGVTLGVNRTCARVVNLGTGSRRWHWSSYGGSWHRVRVHRPRIGWHHGHGMRRLLRGSLALLGGGLEAAAPALAVPAGHRRGPRRHQVKHYAPSASIN